MTRLDDSRFELSGPAYPAPYPGDAELDLFTGENRAIDANRKFGQSLGWQTHYFDIGLRLLGVEMFPISETEFAERVYEWQRRHCFKAVDGILGPNTWAEMQLLLGLMPGQRPKGPVKEVNTPMPKYGPGFCCHKPFARRCGLPETIRALKSVALGWQRTHGAWPRIRIADISLRGGGRIPPHSSHRMGIDVDLWLESAKGENISNSRKRYYSPRLTGELATAFRNDATLEPHKIWYRDKEVAAIDYERDHYRHLHVRFCLPSRYSLAKMKRAAFPGGTRGSYAQC